MTEAKDRREEVTGQLVTRHFATIAPAQKESCSQWKRPVTINAISLQHHYNCGFNNARVNVWFISDM